MIAAPVAAGLLCLALVVPALGAAVGPTKLADPVVAPRSGTTATLVNFSITYRSTLEAPPDYVRVVVGATTYAMSATTTDWKQGVDFSVATYLPAGTMAVRFEARDAEKFVDQADGGTVSIALDPTPTPTPTPVPTLTPTLAPPSPTSPPGSLTTPTPTAPPPTASPTPAPVVGQGSTGGGTYNPARDPRSPDGGDLAALDASMGGGTGGTGSTGGAGGTGGSSEIGGSTGTGGSTESAGNGGSTGPDGSTKSAGNGDSTGPGGTSAQGGSAGSTTRSGPSGATPGGAGSLGSTRGTDGGGVNEGGLTTGPAGLAGGSLPGRRGYGDGSAGASTAWGTDGANGTQSGLRYGLGGSSNTFHAWLGGHFDRAMAALGLHGTGRFPTLPAMLVSSVAVATWMAFLIFGKKRRDEEMPEPAAEMRAHASTGVALVPDADLAEPEDLEAAMPRWRRPSLLEARKTDPIRNPVAPREPMSFTAHSDGMAEATERRQIRYTVVALLDQPDQLRSIRISEVAAGDQVQVVGRSASFCEVVCPDGRRGWIHRTALSEPLNPGNGPWASADVDSPADAENTLATLLVARGLHRKAI